MEIEYPSFTFAFTKTHGTLVEITSLEFKVHSSRISGFSFLSRDTFLSIHRERMTALSLSLSLLEHDKFLRSSPRSR